MTRENQNFTMWAGEAKEIVVTVVDDNEDPKSIAGATVYWKMQNRSNSSQSVTKSTADGIALSDPANGELTITLDPDDTTGLSGVFNQQCRVVDADGDPETVMAGAVIVNAAITQ